MRGTGELEGGQIEEVMFEGYGPGGAAVLVNVATDNRNRTVSEIRHAFSKNGGNMGEQGSVAWMFERKSQIFVPSEKADRRPAHGHRARRRGGRPARRRRPLGDPLASRKRTKPCSRRWKPTAFRRRTPASRWFPRTSSSSRARTPSAMLRLSEALEEHDDVQSVYSNFDIDEKELEALA